MEFGVGTLRWGSWLSSKTQLGRGLGAHAAAALSGPEEWQRQGPRDSGSGGTSCRSSSIFTGCSLQVWQLGKRDPDLLFGALALAQIACLQ